MFKNLTNTTAAAPKADAPFDALAYLDTVLAYEESERAHQEEAELLKRTATLTAALTEHGSTPSLMAFANADGALSAFAGAAPVLALESMSEDARKADAEAVVLAMEAWSAGAIKDRASRKLTRAKQAREVFAARKGSLKARAAAVKDAADKHSARQAELDKAFSSDKTTTRDKLMKSRERNAAIAKGGKYAAIGAAVALAAAGTVYAIKKLYDQSVPGTAKDVEDALEHARKGLAALDKIASIRVSEGADAEAVKNAFGDADYLVGELTAVKGHLTTFKNSGFTPEKFKELVKEVESVHSSLAESCERMERHLGEVGEGEHSEAAHKALALIHEARGVIERNLMVAEKIIARAAHHFTAHKEEGDEAGAGEGGEGGEA